MIKRLLIIGISMQVIISCNQNNSIKNFKKTHDTIAYTYKTIKKESKNIIKAHSTTDTTSISISYPEFNNPNLNRFTDSILSKTDNPDEKGGTINEVANSFISNYDDFLKHEKAYQHSWFSKTDMKVVRQTSDLVCFEKNYSSYTGGAHGINTTYFYSYSIAKQRNLNIKEIVMANDFDKFTAVAEKIFRKNESLSPTAPLDTGYFFENAKFVLNNNFLLGKKNILFLYNPYEIRAYAYGQTKLAIPYSAIADYINPEYLPNSTN